MSVTDPRGNVTISTYDAARRLLTTTTPGTPAAPGGVATTNTWDADNRVTQVQQAVGGSILRTSSSTWTRTGKVATATDPKGNVMRYAYDLLDRAASVTDAAGRVTRFGYDVLSRRTETRNLAIQAAALLKQTYSANGKVTSLIDANTNATAFAYDGFDRLVTTTYPLGSTETFTYDAVDNPLTRKTRANATFTLAYDTLNRLVTKTPPSGPVVTYSYDLAGRLRGASDNSAAITAAAAPGGVTTAYTTSFTYDALNRPAGTSWSPVAAAVSPAAGASVTFGHAYNAVSQRVGQTVSDNTWLAYPSGAPSTVSYAVDSLNRYAAVGGVAQSYDGNSNLTGDGTYAYGYDPENRLVSAAGAGNSAAYAFDAQGRRKTRTVNGTTTVSVTDTQNREVLEYDGSNGQVLRWYAYGLGPNELLGQMNVPAGTRSTPVPDLLGSVVGSMDAVTGTLSKFAYLPYGGSSTAATPFGFTGQRIEPEAGGIYYYRARHYSPVTGRFLQADPADSTGAYVYTYVYVGNDPLNLTDSRGLAPDPNMVYSHSSSGGFGYSSAAMLTGAIGIGAGAESGLAIGMIGSAGALLLPLALSGDTPTDNPGFVYVTYTRTHPETGLVYSGRSSGFGSPIEIAQQRGFGQPLLNTEGFAPPVLDRVATGGNAYEAIRGREQQLINFFGGARSVGGTSRNMINGIADLNPNGPRYIRSSISAFGVLPDNSPPRLRLY